MKGKNTPVHVLQGLLYLDSVNLEEKMFSSQKGLSQIQQSILFKDEIKDFFFDLSQVQFAELNAISQLTLVIEDLIKREHKVYVALPTVRLTIGEENSKNYSDEIKQADLKRRVNANNFLKTTGFVDAIKCNHIKNKKSVLITENFDFESEFKLEIFEEAFSIIYEIYKTEDYNYKYIFPLEWINCQEGFDSFNQIANKIDKILENPSRGLDPLDVQGLKNVVLSELMKNVKEHAKSDFALFTIGLIDSVTLQNKNIRKKTNQIEKEFINWFLTEKIKNQVEIYFGDTGTGVFTEEFLNAYSKAHIQDYIATKGDQLKWAFTKWSTRKTEEEIRGTKGLYRIQRIVNKYNGIFYIRTGYTIGGYRKGGLKREKWYEHRYDFNMPGTFIQIKMCPFSEAKNFRFSLKENGDTLKWRSLIYNPKVNVNFIESFRNEIKKVGNLLVILDLRDFADIDAKLVLENNLPHFSFEAHPNAVVIYILNNFSLGNDTIETIVKSINDKIVYEISNNLIQEIAHKDTEKVYDPVLVISNKNEAYWYGGNQDIINLLNDSFDDDNKNRKLTEILSYKELDKYTKDRIRLHLENDNSLVIVDNEGKFAFNFTNLDDFYSNQAKTLIDLTFNEVGSHKVCTPKLEIVNKWIDIKELLEDNEYGYSLIFYLKFREYISDKYGVSYYDNLNKENLYILIDHNKQKELARALASLIGIKLRNIISASDDINLNIPRRTKLFLENDKVIVLTTIISSSETIRRVVKYVKRDLAEPIGIFCICNLRKHNIMQLETWQDETDIISIYQKNHQNIGEKSNKTLSYFQLKHDKLVQTKEFRDPDHSKVFKNNFIVENGLELGLREHIVNTKSLHYNHVGIFRDRHFTLYIDKEKLLKDNSIIWSKIEESINGWWKDLLAKASVISNKNSKSKNYNDQNFTLYISKSIYNNDSLKKFYFF